MSLWGAVAGQVAGVVVSKLAGGSGNGSGSFDPNFGHTLSRNCGISPSVTRACADWAKTQPDRCAAARTCAGRPLLGGQPIPVTGPGRAPSPFERVLGTVAGAVSSPAQAGVLSTAARFAFTPAVRRRIIAFAKQFGISLAATVFGISVLEVAEIVAKPPRRRRRGITAAQLANARRVNCKIQTMAKSLGMSCTGRAAPRRKTTCR